MKELKPGIFELVPINRKSEYMNINTNNGTIIACVRVCELLPQAEILSLKEYSEQINKYGLNNVFGAKQYQKFIMSNPQIYNQMIDNINNLSI